MKIMYVIKAGHRYSEEVYIKMQKKNRHIATSHYVRMYVREIGEFKVQEIANTRLGQRANALSNTYLKKVSVSFYYLSLILFR